MKYCTIIAGVSKETAAKKPASKRVYRVVQAAIAIELGRFRGANNKWSWVGANGAVSHTSPNFVHRGIVWSSGKSLR